MGEQTIIFTLCFSDEFRGVKSDDLDVTSFSLRQLSESKVSNCDCKCLRNSDLLCGIAKRFAKVSALKRGSNI